MDRIKISGGEITRNYTLIGAVCLSLLSGCGDPVFPINPGLYHFKTNEVVTNSERTSDVLECRIKGAKEVPQNITVQTTPGYLYEGTGISSRISSTDSNSDLRWRVIKECLKKKGYSSNTGIIQTCREKSVPQGYNNDKTPVYPPSNNACLVRAPSGIFGTYDDAVLLRAEDQI